MTVRDRTGRAAASATNQPVLESPVGDHGRCCSGRWNWPITPWASLVRSPPAAKPPTPDDFHLAYAAVLGFDGRVIGGVCRAPITWCPVSSAAPAGVPPVGSPCHQPRAERRRIEAAHPMVNDPDLDLMPFARGQDHPGTPPHWPDWACAVRRSGTRRSVSRSLLSTVMAPASAGAGARMWDRESASGS